MNQTNETAQQSGITKQRAEIEQELRLAKKYWLEEIQPFIKGRTLRDVEFFVAHNAHRILQAAIKKAENWNSSCVATRVGSPLPVSVDDVDLSAENFRAPEVPKMLFADNVKPEILAAIAVPLVKNQTGKLPPVEAIRNAHELLMAAERYIGTLPKKTESPIAEFEGGFRFRTVTFTEIFQSNKNKSGQLPLLPPQQVKRKGRSVKEILDEPLSEKAIKAEVKKFFEKHYPSWMEEEDEGEERNDNEENPFTVFAMECLKNNLISLQDLCTMRWERFKKFGQDQQNRVLTREAKKRPNPNLKS